ncbi:hypothetical protein QBC44DRAFT_369337 [Cladorrhinum sp. PSN332]|nr:hypothetical protein QBC44DRAFT_369337 [Cladorrhinum sp. PSN332]
MGRRPNALILQYFERGPKLKDQSNRYPHTCKACGEHFPRGRLDSLMTHLTKKCPAISEADRMTAFIGISGMSHATQKFEQQQAHQDPNRAYDGSGVDLPINDRDWTALGVLAEVSRQIDLSEKNDDRGQPIGALPTDGAPTSSQPGDRYDLHDQFTMENAQLNPDDEAAKEIKAGPPSPIAATAEERLQEMLRAENDANNDSTNISMAAAATARLHPAYLNPVDPEILSQEAAAAAEAANATAAAEAAAVVAAAVQNSLPVSEQTQGEGARPVTEPIAPTSPMMTPPTTTASMVTVPITVTPIAPAPMPTPSMASVSMVASPMAGVMVPAPMMPVNNDPQTWGDMAYATGSFQANVPPNGPMPHAQVPVTRGGFRLEANGAKSRHSRARFDPDRRREVQEVRKLGACIRCRVLRKTCSKGDPCDTCRKVLSPRVWRDGCVRTKFSEQLDLYSAGVQIVLAQVRVNSIKQTMPLQHNGVVVEACHFPDYESRLQLQVLQRDPERDADGKLVDTTILEDHPSSYPIVMLDNDREDVPGRVETYMREVLPEMIRREPSHFMRVTLEMAVDVANKTNDELLKKSLELWGLVEILDRERQWTITVKNGNSETPVKSIKEETDGELFNIICLQLAAATERKAAATSKALLTGMQRVLQDSKVKIDFNMYFAVLILLNCVEKSTWAFKAWEQENLRHQWPLEKEPDKFASQGYVIANLLRMLLGIRKALPRTSRREADGKLVTEEENPSIRAYFEAIDLDFAQVKAKQEQPAFSPTDPRSFELLFCSTLLLPSND